MPNKSQSKISKAVAKSQMRINMTKQKPQNKSGKNTVDTNRLELLITIVGRSKSEYYLDLIQSFEVNLQVMTFAHGTADAAMRELLGLTDSDKAVIFSVVQENMVPQIVNALEEKFSTIKNGKGVACTVPLSSVIGTLIYGFLSNNAKTVREVK